MAPVRAAAAVGDCLFQSLDLATKDKTPTFQDSLDS